MTLNRHFIKNVNSHKDLLPVALAAKYLDVSLKTLTRWANAGYIPITKTPGGHRRYRMSDLEAFVERMNNTPSAYGAKLRQANQENQLPETACDADGIVAMQELIERLTRLAAMPITGGEGE